MRPHGGRLMPVMAIAAACWRRCGCAPPNPSVTRSGTVGFRGGSGQDRARSLYVTAAHAPGDQPPLHRRDQSTDEGSVAHSEFATLSEARLAATGDLLNVAKALLARVATQSLRHRWSDSQLPGGSCPSECPSGEKAHRFCVRKYASELGGAKRARTADLLHAISRQLVHPRPSVQVTVSGRPHQSSGIQAGCCTFVLYGSEPPPVQTERAQLPGDARWT